MHQHTSSQEISPTFYATLKFNTMFKRACHWSLSWDTWIQSIPPPLTLMPLISILLLPSNLCLQIQVVSFFQVLQPKSIYTSTVIRKHITWNEVGSWKYSTIYFISSHSNYINSSVNESVITCTQLIVKTGTEDLAGTWMTTFIFSRVWHVAVLMEGTQYEVFAFWYIHPQQKWHTVYIATILHNLNITGKEQYAEANTFCSSNSEEKPGNSEI
jgi:hypothetical protein